MADIFISYAREDRPTTEQLANALMEQGWSVWWDPQIRAGKTFDEVIEQAINAARCILVLWSKQSVNSRWVRTEANEGLERGILVPLLIDDVHPPLAFRRIQTANLIEWDGTNSHTAFVKLVSDIASLLGPPPAAVEIDRHEVEGQAIQNKPEVLPEVEKQEPRQSSISSTRFLLSRKWLLILGGSIVIVAIVLAVMFLSVRKPISESGVPSTELPKHPQAPAKPTPVPSSEVTEIPPSETTPDHPQLSPSQWREVQQALNDIGFDAGTNDGVPGAKTRNAITLYLLTRGFPPSNQLSEVPYQRLLADAQLAVAGRLIAMLPEMIKIPAGCFHMGSPTDEEGRHENERQHEVCVEAFMIGKTEVTQQQWREVMGDNPSDFKDCDDCPVENFSWYDVDDFLQKLNHKTGKKFRLPTEAEWEYAARAGTTGPFSFQGKISASKVNYNADYTYDDSRRGRYRGKTIPVGSLPANPWGLHEVHGNVWEWTCSAFVKDYNGSEKQCADRSDSSRRVIRGGSWYHAPTVARSAARINGSPDYTNAFQGFRLAQGEMD